MTFYYDNIGYKCKYKSGIKMPNMWYSTEQAKLTVRMPKDVYKKIQNDIKVDTKNNTLRDILRFKVLFLNGENKTNKENQYFYLESYLDRSTITSSFANGEISVIFMISSTYNVDELGKDEIRDLMLANILN